MKLSILFAAVAYAQEVTTVTQDDTPVAADDECRSNGADVPCDKKARSGAGEFAVGTDADRAEKRYNDLKDMAVKLWAKNGLRGKKNGFDERKYWAYGCHCFLLGDRPMSEMGSGKPKDALDNKCKIYKDCQKCVRENHGDTCIGEMIKYIWKWSSKLNTFESTNAAGSCQRELFECDKAFVYDTFATKDVFETEYHAFWSTQNGGQGFDHEDPANCPSGGNSPVAHSCCGGHNQPWFWMAENKNQCCASEDGETGNVVSVNDSCQHGSFIAP